MVLQGVFVIPDIAFGCDGTTYNSSCVQELSLLTQVSGITTLQSLAMQGGLTKHGLVYEKRRPLM